MMKTAKGIKRSAGKNIIKKVIKLLLLTLICFTFTGLYGNERRGWEKNDSINLADLKGTIRTKYSLIGEYYLFNGKEHLTLFSLFDTIKKVSPDISGTLINAYKINFFVGFLLGLSAFGEGGFVLVGHMMDYFVKIAIDPDHSTEPDASMKLATKMMFVYGSVSIISALVNIKLSNAITMQYNRRVYNLYNENENIGLKLSYHF